MNKPILLDLFCGEGGAARGYQMAGFHVVGVDIKPQPNYAGDEFIHSDVFEFLDTCNRRFDAVHASPPCQVHTTLASLHKNSDYFDRHLDLIPQTRERLRALGKPYLIENVPGAPLENSVMLCGTQFGLKVYRHRYFESNCLLLVPSHVKHKDKLPGAGRGASPNGYITVVGGGGFGRGVTLHQARASMGCDWPISRRALSQAIPPQYTQFLGSQLMGYVK